VALIKDDLMLLYRNMVRGRKFNELIVELLAITNQPEVWNFGYGNEGVEAGAASYLYKDDWVWSTQTSITASLAKGLDPIVWLNKNISHLNGQYNGIGRHIKKQKRGSDTRYMKPPRNFARLHWRGSESAGNGLGRVLVYLFEQDSNDLKIVEEWIEESMSCKLPIIWVCLDLENADIPSMSTANNGKANSNSRALNKLPCQKVDGYDAFAVANTIYHAVRWARIKGEPSVVVCKLFQSNFPNENYLYLHSGHSWDTDEWMGRDPILILRDKVIKNNIAKRQEFEDIERGIIEEVTDARNWALSILDVSSE
jgi:pyruvate dehydrogenase E1 component alpha subunit